MTDPGTATDTGTSGSSAAPAGFDNDNVQAATISD